MRKIRERHGLTHHKLYNTYVSMRSRCYSLKDRQYKNYGARGIIISDEFKDNPKAFIEYIESLPNYHRRKELGLTLDRIKNNGNYERGNLRWATQIEQHSNRRRFSKRGNIIILDDEDENIL